MRKLKQALSSRRGEMYIRAAVLVVVILMIFSVLLNYTMTTVMAKAQRKSAQQILDEYTQLNAIEIYNSIKNSHDSTQSLNPDVFISTLCTAQYLEESGGTYISYTADGDVRYRISDISMSFYEANTTKILASYTLTVPLKYMGNIWWADIPVTISTSLHPKFDSSTP